MPNQVQVGNQDVVTRTAIAEAGTQGGALGLQAVLAAIYNRAKQTGLTMEQVVTQPGQFEPHMTNAGRARMARISPRSSVYQLATTELGNVLGGADPTNGADHFYAPVAQRQATDGRAPVPKWARGKRPSAVIGGHEFFSLGYGNRSTRVAAADASPAAPSPIPAAPPKTAEQLLEGGPRTGTLSGEQLLEGELPTRSARAGSSGPSKQELFAAAVGGAPANTYQEATGEVRMELEGNFLSNAARDTWDSEHSGVLDSLGASVRLNSVTGAVTNLIRDQLSGRERTWDAGFDYDARAAELEQGLTGREVDRLRYEARSETDAQAILASIAEDRALRGAVGTGFWGGTSAVLGGFVDPAGLVIGGGVGTAFRGIGIGSRTLAVAGNRAGLVGSIAAEGAIGGALSIGAIDAAGTYVTPGDYVGAMVAGSVLNQLSLPFVSRAGNKEASLNNLMGVQAAADRLHTAAAEAEVDVLVTAGARAGPEATPEEVARLAVEEHNAQAAAPFINTINPMPADLRFTSPDYTPTPERVDELEARAVNVADPTTRGLVTQMLDLGENIDTANPHKGRNDILEEVWLKMPYLPSTGLTMLRSASPFFRGIAKAITEVGSGQAGRRHSVALDASINERAFMNPMMGWESNLDLFRKEQGVSMHTRYTDGGVFERQFNDRVALEMRNRKRPDLYPPDESPYVRKAADMAGETYRIAGEAQIKAGTLGSEAIKADVSYFQQSLDPAKVLRLAQGDPKRLDAYRKLFAQQGEQIFGWDKKFSDEFSRTYMNVALDKATGGYQSPANLSHGSAGDIIMETLTNMREKSKGAAAGRLDDEIAKFSRGGANYTKSRLDWDMTHSYDFNGESIRLLDLASTDMLSLTRNYARRAAGEIGLHKVGIDGRHGVDLMRRAAAIEVQAGRATQAELDAFDQVMSELLGTEFSKAVRVPALQNLNMINSAIRLGGMAITQFGESVNMLTALGVSRTLGFIPAIPRMIGEVRGWKRGDPPLTGALADLERTQGFGFGMDSWILDRALDNKDAGVELYGTEHVGLISKASRGAAHLNAIYSGQRIMTGIQTRYVAEEIVQKAFTYIRKGKEDRALADMGFSPELREAIKANMDKIAVFKGGRIMSTDVRSGLTPGQIQELIGVVHRGAGQIIQRTFVGETGKWAHNDVVKSLAQFRTFSLTAVEKQWGRNIQTMGHVRAFITLGAVTSIVAPLHIARVHLRSMGMEEAERKEYLEKNLDPFMIAQSALNYTSNAGLLGDLWGMGGAAGDNILGDAAPDWLSGAANPRGNTRPGQFLGGAVMPSASILQDTFELANGNWAKLRSLLPGSNLPAVVPVLNATEAVLDDEEE